MLVVLLGAALGIGLALVAASLLPRRADDGIGGGARRDPGPVSAVRAQLALAGLASVPVTAFLVVSAALGVVAGGAAHAAFGIPALTIAATCAGAAVGPAVVRVRVRRRRAAHRSLWPDVVDHLVAAVRSGSSLPDAVSSLAAVGPESLRPAFAEFARDYRATASFGGCLDRLKTALADPVADRILETLRMARDVGGTNLPSVLRGLSAFLREETALRAEVDARQSWVRNAAKLGVAAPWAILLLLASRPEAALAYGSSLGAVVIAGGAVVSVVAYRVMLAIGRLPEERRWFR